MKIIIILVMMITIILFLMIIMILLLIMMIFINQIFMCEIKFSRNTVMQLFMQINMIAQIIMEKVLILDLQSSVLLWMKNKFLLLI